MLLARPWSASQEVPAWRLRDLAQLRAGHGFRRIGQPFAAQPHRSAQRNGDDDSPRCQLMEARDQMVRDGAPLTLGRVRDRSHERPPAATLNEPVSASVTMSSRLPLRGWTVGTRRTTGSCPRERGSTLYVSRVGPRSPACATDLTRRARIPEIIASRVSVTDGVADLDRDHSEADVSDLVAALVVDRLEPVQVAEQHGYSTFGALVVGRWSLDVGRWSLVRNPPRRRQPSRAGEQTGRDVGPGTAVARRRELPRPRSRAMFRRCRGGDRCLCGSLGRWSRSAT
jgi:hypothetical protein